MAKLSTISGTKGKERTLTLVYGLRLYPIGAVAQASGGAAVLRDGTSSQVPLQVIEGTRKQIRAQLLASLESCFDRDSDDVVEMTPPSSLHSEGVEESGC